ncbi:hypothetical protein TIFTF001_034080 [Ficus carica]|uniref:RNase H type-1 domain-containing protein n=1 Tax=Ficus carica TaxID=3494 RepID=A0AA88DZA5_FICCA|nr:hypothetical protein TIFTF001_034080 [Ficus carica]
MCGKKRKKAKSTSRIFTPKIANSKLWSAVCAFVARDHNGSVCSTAASDYSTTEALVAEAVGFLLALAAAKRYGWQPIVIECDSALATAAISNRMESCPWSLLNIKNDRVLLRKEFKDAEFQCSPREVNFAAHNLAKWAKSGLFLATLIRPQFCLMS